MISSSHLAGNNRGRSIASNRQVNNVTIRMISQRGKREVFLQILFQELFEKLQIVPMLIVTPLAFLGGSFYSISMLPPLWQTITLANPVVYLISGFRWSFYDVADVNVGVSLGMTVFFLLLCLALITWMFRSGYRLKQ